MPSEHCPNCGVLISDTPEEDGLHPVQMAQPVEGGEVYCEACAFQAPDHGEYEHTGDRIARAAQVDMSDEELAKALAEELQVQELREWMSASGLQRSRGARKLESAEQAVEQDRVLVASTIDSVRGLTEKPHSAMCSCGFEAHFMDEDAAVDAAREHKSENPEHFPKAWGDGGNRRLYG